MDEETNAPNMIDRGDSLARLPTQIEKWICLVIHIEQVLLGAQWPD